MNSLPILANIGVAAPRQASEFGVTQFVGTSQLLGISPQDPSMLRMTNAQVILEFQTPSEQFFNAYSRWAGYEHWAPDVQGASHWLVVRQDGPGSQFVLYDKPGNRHLAHLGTVTELDRNRRFAWRAPFSEWSWAFIGTILEIEPTSSGSSRVMETLYFDAHEDHLPVIAGFMALSDYDSPTMNAFLKTRLTGLDRLIRSNTLAEQDLEFLFNQNQVVAVDWSGWISAGEDEFFQC